jgi:hypothetical protein
VSLSKLHRAHDLLRKCLDHCGKFTISYSECYTDKITNLEIGDMPSNWQELSPQYQDQARSALNDNIVTGINEITLKMGL